MRLKSLLDGLSLRAAVVFATVALAVGLIGGTACGEASSDGELPAFHVGNPAYDPGSVLITTDLETHPLEAHQTEDEVEPSELKKVPEPATVVSLAWLAAMAGSALLLRLRWFRRR